MIEEQIQFKVLIANLNPNLLSNESEAVSKLQQKVLRFRRRPAWRAASLWVSGRSRKSRT